MEKIRPMHYKNGDLGMWHSFGLMAEHLKFVAQAEEQTLYSLCESYSYDDSAFEEYCNQEKIERSKDFHASEECWKCPYYRVREKKSAKTDRVDSLEGVNP